MERLNGAGQELLLEECKSIEEVNAFVDMIFDGRCPRITSEMLNGTGKVSREVGGLEIEIAHLESRYIVLVKHSEHYDNI